ncbi:MULTISPECIES: hypothetical protein [Psychrobacter]|uniref:Uncharacterized protein n=1 Tax=Psychrobacter alimentarius TaxID=261164 RepID=A0ABN4N2Q2_9GAMM|nr:MULTISPECIES: hypothetical protein [Psychrobacter]AMT97245.1 hypothetical protein A3K91_1644 [Psychrobacter alimentarius]QCB30430.1 hypothetical protein E5677_05165 [Psychrobacter sp. PAMC27889]
MCNLNLTSKEDSLEITEPSMLIRINELFRDDMSDEELYNATRSSWRVSLNRANNVEYALSVYKGIVREVYLITAWQEADPTAHEKNNGRFEFIGNIAEDTIRNKYKLKSVKHYFKKGNMAPFMYINS